MNRRGQAALEYLMTYGWALIVIAIVVGVLVFIVSSPAGEVVCSSSDPAKIMVKASQMDEAPTAGLVDFGDIILVNLTGGNMSSVTYVTTAPTGAFAGNDNTTLGPTGTAMATSITSGVQFTINPDELAAAGVSSTSTITINYNDYAALARSATITCSGPITTLGA